jgi:hypothetical protein
MSKRDRAGVPAPAFTLWCNGSGIDFNSDILRDCSTKAADLIASGQLFAVIPQVIPAAVLSVFTAALSNRRFALTPEIAFPAQALGLEWGVASLVDLANTFIDTNHLEQPDEKVALDAAFGRLIAAGIGDPNDVLLLANNITEALADPRIQQIPPQVAFDVIQTARAFGGFDEANFSRVVLKLFEKNPDSAVTLVLLLDFDSLGADQRASLFQSRELHERTVGFFIADALSGARNQASRDLAQAAADFRARLRAFRAGLQAKEAGAVAELQGEEAGRIAELRAELAKQQQQIDALKAAGVKHKAAIARAAEQNDADFADLQDQLARLASFTSQQSAQAAGQTSRLGAQIAEQMDSLA